MRVLVVGAGGVGSAVVPIAARRDFFERIVVADYDPSRAERAIAPVAEDGRRLADRCLAPRGGNRARDFPEGIGPVECVNVEHEEVLLVPRRVAARRVTFKYGLGDEIIDVLRTLHKLGLDGTTS